MTDMNVRLIQLLENVSRRASMHYSCAMMSPKATSLEEEGRADVDGAEREGRATESDCRDQSWALLRLMVV